MPAPESTPQIAHLADVPLEVEVELDRHAATIHEVLQLSIGSILTLNKAAGEPVDILIGGKHIACGEVIVFNESAGVRISEFNLGS
jgi:flagellar motor switch protein FliN/FliY